MPYRKKERHCRKGMPKYDSYSLCFGNGKIRTLFSEVPDRKDDIRLSKVSRRSIS